MYSTAWFDTFAATVPERLTVMEVNAIWTLAPPGRHPRLLDLGCGVGRLSAPLQERGFSVTGLDVSVPALLTARGRAPRSSFVALDQRHVGHMRWQFDVAVSVWNSLGVGTRQADLETLAGLRRVLCSGGKLLLDLFHPEWLVRNERADQWDPRGATIRRWVQDGRCLHEIRYVDGAVDDIQFNVYAPAEIATLLEGAGFAIERTMAWWDPAIGPGPEHARYQVVCTRGS